MTTEQGGTIAEALVRPEIGTIISPQELALGARQGSADYPEELGEIISLETPGIGVRMSLGNLMVPEGALVMADVEYGTLSLDAELRRDLKRQSEAEFVVIPSMAVSAVPFGSSRPAHSIDVTYKPVALPHTNFPGNPLGPGETMPGRAFAEMLKPDRIKVITRGYTGGMRYTEPMPGRPDFEGTVAQLDGVGMAGHPARETARFLLGGLVRTLQHPKLRPDPSFWMPGDSAWPLRVPEPKEG